MDHLQNVLSYFDQQQPLCAEHDRIPKDLYREFGVKAGLRDETGKGVLAGLTNISDIRAFRKRGTTPGHSLEKLPAALPEKTVLIRDGIHLHSEYSFRLQKGYFGVKVLFVNKKRTKSESCRMRVCPLAQGWFLRR